MHNTNDYSCFDEKQDEEIHHFSHESLEGGGNVVLPTWRKEETKNFNYFRTQTFILNYESQSELNFFKILS